jgi:hypothetical protein
MKYSVRRPSGDWYYLTIPEDCRIAILPRPVQAGPGHGGSTYQIRVYRGPGTKKCLGQFFGTEVIAEEEGIEISDKHPKNMADKLAPSASAGSQHAGATAHRGW